MIYEQITKYSWLSQCCSNFLQIENATDVSFFWAVNLKLPEEREGIEIANHFVDLSRGVSV